MTAGAAPAPRRDAAEQARLEAAVVELFEHRIAFNQVLGLKVASLRPGEVAATFAMRPELIGHVGYGRLHGGVISAVLDAVGGLALMAGLAEQHAHEPMLPVLQRLSRMATIDLRTDFLRPGLGPRFVASAEITRLGRRLASTQMRLHDDTGTLLATGAAAYVVA